MSGEGRVVCVTGASGFIASWLVKLLLQRGYTVKGTVRDSKDPKKTEHLLALEGAKERLQLFKADLLDEGSFDPVVEGCEGVFHAASPLFASYASTNPQAELIDPAVKGTLNVLQACSKVASVKRVVLTSSIGSMFLNERPLTPDVVVDETWFSDPKICKDSESWYILGKTLAEQVAWNFAKENGLDLVSLNPVIVIGPLLRPILNFSVELLLNIVNGVENPGFTSGYMFVDVRDVGNAHIQAFETPSANGRYCMADRVVHISEVLKILKNLYPTLELTADIPPAPVYKISKERAESLGINLMPLEVSVRDTIESLKEKGFVSF